MRKQGVQLGSGFYVTLKEIENTVENGYAYIVTSEGNVKQVRLDNHEYNYKYAFIILRTLHNDYDFTRIIDAKGLTDKFKMRIYYERYNVALALNEETALKIAKMIIEEQIKCETSSVERITEHINLNKEKLSKINEKINKTGREICND